MGWQLPGWVVRYQTACRPTLSVCVALLVATGLWPAVARSAPGNIHGLPFTRFYSFEEIGSASRGARLGFDELGRIAVTRGGACAVLNDTAWTDIADRSAGAPVMERLVFGPQGDAYFCAFGSWGTAQIIEGRLHPSTLVSGERPAWLTNANFGEIIPLRDGIFFGCQNGIVYWERASGRHTFFEVPSVARLFAVGQTLYVSSHLWGISRLNLAAGRIERLKSPVISGSLIEQAVALDDTQVVLSSSNGRLFLFDGTVFSPFPGILTEQPLGRVTAMTRLPEGHIAMAISGAGVYLVAADGTIHTSLTTPEYHRVTDLAARESGVLWIVTESGVEKILYNSALTSFGQRQGLPLSWPQLVRWRDRIVVASGGRLYEAMEGRTGETTRFQLLRDQPSAGIWAMASDGTELLVGTSEGVYARAHDGSFLPVLTDINASRLACAGGTFFILGSSQLAAVRLEKGQWVECAPRVPGLGYPLVVHATNHAAWIEFGPNRAARVGLRDGQLTVRMFDQFPWTAPRWVNIGWAGDTVALTGNPDGRIFFDEQTESLVERPELARLLAEAPHPINRFREDRDGTIWATHDEGLLTIQRQGDHPVYDATTFGKINDRFPLAQLLPDDDVWLVTGQSLYHVDRSFRPMPRFHGPPVLVSMTNGRSPEELLPHAGQPDAIPQLAYRDNSLVLRFFAGSYASRLPPNYEFRVHRGNDSWVAVGNSSLLTLTNLREGSYRLEARIKSNQQPRGGTFSLRFEIAPPWYRTWYAYACYALGIVSVVHGLMRWSAHRTRSRNVVLEKLVAERTNELRVAMQQLNEETRNAATLAERDRLAGEIHDSLQQGLSGVMLHLDATLKLADLPADVRSRLSVARNMVSFTRHEVQHAV
ncbi:MAG TPA: histidine kinase, partial [Lacunisphaera sp.]|nr:histidine kinase [Lacunisphaera sp.]